MGETSRLLRNALLKLEASLPAPYLQDIRTAQSRFLFDDTPWWSEQAVVPYLEVLRAAVWRSCKLQVQYRKQNGEVSRRILHPYGLIVKQGAWYLAAYCEEAGEVRTFKCERLAAVQLMDEICTIPDNFSLQTYWTEGEQAFKKASKAREIYPVVIRTPVHNQDILLRLDVMGVETAGEFQLITANMYDYETACGRVLPLLVQAEIVEPGELREYIGKHVRIWDKMYS